mmetsp:Transcript_138663/g.258648  ORF Transcript_138663/g.258648 Transcript_138663/m.258648 type:complete len:114 (+) Transcript_138663:56-397(+)
MSDDAPFPGESPETLDEMRQECSLLRQKITSLEADNANLNSQVQEWKRWYGEHYRPQIQFLEGEVSRLCAMAPPLAPIMAADVMGKDSEWQAPPPMVPPGAQQVKQEASKTRR